MQKTQKITIFCAILLHLLCLTQPASAFNITSLALYEDDNGATTTPATAMTPTDEMTLAFTITDASLKELSITIYDSALTTQSACYNTDNQESANRCAWAEWKNNSGEELFADIRPTQTSWAIDKPNSQVTAASASKFVFTPSKSSRYSDTSSWAIHLRANNGTEEKTKTITLNNTYYLQLEVSKSSVEFEPGRKNTNNHHIAELTSDGYDLTYIPLTITSNAPYSWKVKSTDFLGGSTIPVSNNTLGAALRDTPSAQTYLNTTYKDIETAHAPTTDSGDQKQLFMWLDYPDDPDTTYTGTLRMQAYITADPSESTSEQAVSMSAGTDNTKPEISIITPSPLAWTKNGYTVGYSINVTDTHTGFMNSLGSRLCSIYFGGTQVSQVYIQKNPTYKTCKCEGSFTVPQTGNKNVNLNVTVEDMAGNAAYNDTIWLQLDQSSLQITDVALVSTAKPSDIDWYFLPDDTFRIVGHIKNQAGDAVNSTLTSYLSIPGAAVTVNSSAISSSSPYTTGSQGNIDIEYAFTGSTVGPATLYLAAKDSMNNTASWNRTFHITNYINSIQILTNFTDKIYSQGDNISIEVGTNTGTDPAHMANITAQLKNTGSTVVRTAHLNTGTDGKAQFYIDIPKTKEEYYTLSVTGLSPLDTTKTVSNTTAIDTEWLDIEVNIHTDGYIDTNQSTKISVSGRVDYSDDPGNDTLVEGASVTCLIKGPGSYNDTDTATLNSTSEYTCSNLKNITRSGKYRFEISAEKTISGFKISGWNKEKYITITNLSEMQAQGALIPGAAPGAAALNITGYQEKIYLEQGKNTTYSFTLKNTGDTVLENITLGLTSDDTGVELLRFQFSGMIPQLKKGKEIPINISIISPNASKPKDYNISIYLESCNGTNTTASFTLQITHGDASKQRINSISADLENKIRKLRRDMNTLMPTKDEYILVLDKGVKDIEDSLKQLKQQIAAGDYAAAEDTISETGTMLAYQQDIIKNEIEKKNKKIRQSIIIAIIIIIIILVSFLLYYMWLPEIPTEYEFEKKSTNPLSNAKNTAKQKIGEYLEKLKRALKQEPKYNYHRKDRWSSS
ncbi:MAG: hypothetical protein U9Q92_05455 [archaeon]|nr:hypothetical protein [archaeon]